MAVERHNSYIPPSTDTSFGTNSNSLVPAQPAYRGNPSPINRVQLQGNDGLVQIGSVRTTYAAALAAGLITENNLGNSVALPTKFGAELTDEGKQHDANKRIAEQQASKEASKEQQLFNAHNDALDRLEGSMTREQYSALVTAGLDMADDAIDFIESVSPSIIEGYYRVAQQVARQNGLENVDAMSVILSPERQREARACLIRGDQTGFAKFVHETLSQARSAALQPDFIEQIELSGGHIVNGNLIYQGKNLGDVGRCILSGIIKID